MTSVSYTEKSDTFIKQIIIHSIRGIYTMFSISVITLVISVSAMQRENILQIDIFNVNNVALTSHTKKVYIDYTLSHTTKKTNFKRLNIRIKQ